MRTIVISLFVALCTIAPSLFAQFTMGGLGTSMGMMGGLQGMGMGGYGNAMGNAQGIAGMGGMSGGDG